MRLASAPSKVPLRSTPSTVRNWGEAIFVAGLVVALYAATLADLAIEWWTQPEASHGLLIPPLAVYIAYMQRRLTLAIPPTRDGRGLWLTALGCLLFLFGRLSAEFFLARMSFVLLLAGLAWTFWGVGRLKSLSFPFILLTTMVPLPVIVYNSVATPLQLFASTVSTDLAQRLGVSIYREGNIIHLSNVSLGVAEACSGLHSLSALMVGSLLLGFVNQGGVRRKAMLFLLSAPLAVGVNVLRVTGTAMLADVRLEFAMGFYHSFSGWLVFTLGFGFLWLMAKLIFPRPENG